MRKLLGEVLTYSLPTESPIVKLLYTPARVEVINWVRGPAVMTT